jgi:plastocyanin
MPQPHEWNISITSSGDPSPSALSCNPGDKITWKNDYSESVTAFTLPTCVAPQTDPAPIAAGATTSSFTVNSGASGTYDYSYDFPSKKRAPRSGTIDVGSR